MAASDQEYHTEFGNRLKAARVLRGMSIPDLAEAVNVPDQHVQLYEEGSGAMPFLMIWRATNVLDVPFGFFTIAFDAKPAANGQFGERFSKNDSATGQARPLVDPKIEWALQNLANTLSEMDKAETGECADEANSIPRETPDNEPPN